MNQTKRNVMNKKFKTIASVMVVFAFVVTTVLPPASTAIALTQLDSGIDFSPGTNLDTNLDLNSGLNLDTNLDLGSNLDLGGDFDLNYTTDTSGGAYSSDFIECVLDASKTLVTTGESFTLNWSTSGFDTITINGNTVSADSGSMVINNLQESTIFTLQALSNGGSSCVQQVQVTCLPPETPKYCELDVQKSVNKTVGLPGDELIYTITVKNVGDADCTGGGVKIVDVVDTDLNYAWYQVSSNLSAGYGTSPVYTASDRTLRFNGHVLEPGEVGTITWGGTVKTPAQCGDFEVTNQAKASAKELNNFQTWEYSQTVRTLIDTDCYTPVPRCDSFTATPAVITVGETTLLSWETTNATAVSINNGIGAVSVDGTRVVSPTVNTTYVLTAYGTGQTVTCSVPVTVTTIPAPSCDMFTATPSTITTGGTVTLTWETTNAESVTINNGVGVVAADGSVSVSPTTNTTYVMTVAGLAGQSVTCSVPVTVTQPPAPSCDYFSANPTAIMVGDSATLTWNTSNATDVVMNNGIGAVSADGSIVVSPTVDTTYTLTVYGATGQSVTCSVPVDVSIVPVPSCDLFTATPSTILLGESATLTWESSNADQVFINNGIGAVSADGSISVTPLATITYTLTVIGQKDQVTECQVPVTVEVPKLPSCDLFVANPSGITVGDSTTLTWETTNATEVSLDNGIGIVAVDGTHTVSPTTNTTYILTVKGENDQTVNCTAPVTVSEDPVPVCEFFTATPNQLPYGGGPVSLNWEVTGANTVSITPTIGTVGLTGSQSLNVTESTTFTLTAIDGNNDQVSCVAPVAVADPEPVFTCADNVTFTADDYSITRGSESTLNWSTTNVDTVSISNINATSLSGSQSVTPSDDTTYTLTATQGDKTITCPLTIDVSSGGGGGGSSSPRCELDISDTRISRGDEVTLTWDTSRATEVTIKDDRGEILFTTDDYLASDKEDYYDGELTLRPTRDTKFTLLAERGSREDECTVAVAIDDDVVVLQTRDQQPLVAGISLSQVPYTGFEAGPIMTFLFYGLLVAWAFFITYLLVIRKRTVTDSPVNFTKATPSPSFDGVAAMQKAEGVKPDLFVKSVTTTPAPADFATPSNLPTGTPAIGYENHKENEVEVPAVNPHQVDDAVVTDLENRAHAQKALLSSDAVRHFVGTTTGEVERNEALDTVIAEAKKTYPLEDGWIVINEARMRNLCDVCQVGQVSSSQEPFIPATVPEGTGSLAEAIVTGNIVAAYEMIGKRPMFALADASADLDAVYRNRKGGSEKVSDMLTRETTRLSDGQLKNAISALTSALDGTYTSEQEAVKMAIMKAVKAVS
ncbi:MAG: DUF11 domain-containing protein [Candidatus Kaiserbacteria bacterium]|nr:DUF11 domain-containing protein [Candidatus Kaiserbacteria bacterium]MCB9816243.1 DUF11 domain-containing protein [Candidatus Nomurabacteria bacterium]